MPTAAAFPPVVRARPSPVGAGPMPDASRSANTAGSQRPHRGARYPRPPARPRQGESHSAPTAGAQPAHRLPRDARSAAPVLTERPSVHIAPPALRRRAVPAAPAVLVAVSAVVAVAARVAVADVESFDYVIFLRPWYDELRAGGPAALADPSFADYNVPYLYLLLGLTALPVDPLHGIKAVSFLGDVAIAVAAHRIVAVRGGRWAPAVTASVLLLLPTVVTNSGYWGQSDALYTAPALWAVWALLHRRPWTACALLGLALAVKLQAVFLLPALLVLVLLRVVPWRCLLAVPAVVLLLDVPALLLGAPPAQLLTVYLRQAGQYPDLTLNAPNLYQLLPLPDAARPAAIALTGLVVAAGTWWVVRRRPTTDATPVVLLMTTSALVVPYLLPGMHERYFYPADVLTVVAVAFGAPWWAAVLTQVASFGSYLVVLGPTAGSEDAPPDAPPPVGPLDAAPPDGWALLPGDVLPEGTDPLGTAGDPAGFVDPVGSWALPALALALLAALVGTTAALAARVGGARS
jgi:Gpi18-like mannosyltransferase